MMLSRTFAIAVRSTISHRCRLLGVETCHNVPTVKRYSVLQANGSSGICILDFNHSSTKVKSCLESASVPSQVIPFSSENKRPFSTTSSLLSASEKVANLYKKRDQWNIKRQQFFKKFAAARFVNAAPESWKPYLQLVRADKPIGTYLLYFPCAFGICLATPLGSLPDLYHLGLFAVGAFLMRGAGCIINDIWDKDIDKHVERTKSRPLASGKLSTKNAIAMLAVQLSLSLGILLSLNTTCIAIGFASIVPVVLYPLAKRVTYFPQAALGLTFNIGAIMGYAAVAGHIDWTVVLPLYAGCFLWTMYYDTIYAIQDAQDDLLVGVKSTALLFLASGDVEELKKLPVMERLEVMDKAMNTLRISLAACYGGTMMCWMLSFFLANCASAVYLIPALQLFKCHPSEQRVNTPQACWEKFERSRNVGFGVLLSIIAGIYFAHPR